jgi:hypothetical protein
MAATKYTYSIADDFPATGLASDRLAQEIGESSIVTALDRIDTSGDVCDIWFKDALSSADKTTLDGDTTDPAGGLIAAHDGEPLVSESLVTVENVPTVIPDLSTDSRATVYSPNFCDRCSWYPESIEVVDEVLTPDGTYETYSSAHSFWIDLYHGRVSDEDDLVANYPIVIKVDDVVQTMDAPFGAGGDGDFSLDPESGEITFHTPLTSENVVEASYHYADGSEWVVKPAEGKKLELKKAEVQMSLDINIHDTLQYSIYVMGNPVKVKKYKTPMDYINESNGAYPLIKAFGGDRGLSQDVQTFPWEYLTKTVLLDSLQMEVRVKLSNDQVCGGEGAVVTFYCVSSDE